MFHIITPDPSKPFTIGRKEGSDLRFGDLFVSREHAVIEKKEQEWHIRNLTENSVTLINGEPVDGNLLKDGDVIVIGVRKLRINLKDSELSLLLMESNDDTETIHLSEKFTNITYDNDDSKNQCLEARLQNGKAVLSSLKKFVNENGKKTKELLLQQGQSIRIANTECTFTGENLLLRHSQIGFDLSIKDLDVFAGKKQILSDINFYLPSGEILAIIGRSGQGKSTLLRLLEGVYTKSSRSTVLIGGVDYRSSELRKKIAFLPQVPALRKDLTVAETLLHGAKTTMDKEIFISSAQERIDKFCELFGLSHRKHDRIQTLSGGEERRVALAQELMSSPGLIILDEPLSGLDPYNAHILCNHLKQLAFLGHTVILTTHSYETLQIANKVLVLHQGKQGFYGSPQEAYRYFKTNNAGEILSELNEETAVRWQKSSSEIKEKNTDSTAGILFLKNKKTPLFFYNVQLILRQWFRDKGKMLALILQPIIIGFLFSQIFSKSSSLWTIAFAIILCANWFSLSLSIREIVQEKNILQNDLRKGMSLHPYLFSKVLIPTIFAFIQTYIVYLFVALRVGISLSYPMLSLILLTTVIPAITVGILVSSLAKNPGQANAFLPLLIIPQVALAGALVPFDQMQWVGKNLSYLIWSRYNQSSLLDLMLARSVDHFHIGAATLLAFIFYIVTIIILQQFKKAK